MKTKILQYTLISGAILIGAALFFLFKDSEFSESQVMSITWIVTAALFIWLGNLLISKGLDKHFSWQRYGNWRFFSQQLIILIYSLSMINLLYVLFKVFLTEANPDWVQLIVANVYGILIIVPVSSIYFGIYFLKSWNESKLEEERLQKESTKAQLLALRNHLDPHFLFNNLNILSALIDTDRRQSQEYLEKFAEVYRVILQTDKEELITLRDELKFVEAYLYLVKIRFQELLEIKIKVAKEKLGFELPPLTIQMLIENALKHNTITEDEPLVVEITSAGNFLIVSNNLNKNPNAKGQGSGLENISLRYSYYTDNRVQIDESQDKFTVKVPLIDIEEYKGV